MCQVPETSTDPFFLIGLHFLEKIKLTPNNTELKGHSINDFDVIIILDKTERFTSFFIELLGYVSITLIWSILLPVIISLHMCLIL